MKGNKSLSKDTKGRDGNEERYKTHVVGGI